MKSRVVFRSQTVEWATPQAVWEQLNREFSFDLDPCPLGGTEDGLARLFCSWADKKIYCNPPYNRQREFFERAHEAALAVYLVPARTDTKLFHELILPHATEIRFIRGRLKFGGAKNCAPFPSMIVIYDSRKQKPQDVPVAVGVPGLPPGGSGWQGDGKAVAGEGV